MTNAEDLNSWPEDWPMSAVREIDLAHERISELERELAEAREQLRLANVDNFGTMAELAEANRRIGLAADNTFESVLWRRLATDLRVPNGWCYDDMERHFREVVRLTLADFPPNELIRREAGEVASG